MVALFVKVNRDVAKSKSKLRLKSELKQKLGTKIRASMTRFRALSSEHTNCGCPRWLLLLAIASSVATASIHNHSANNRGGWPRSFKDLERSASMFGQRTKSLGKALEKRQDVIAEKSPIAWSQPDPRKSYSLPLAMAVHTRRQAATNDHHHQSNKPEKQNKFHHVSNGPSNNQSVSSTTRPSSMMGANRRSAAGETVTLIKYVPLLMQLPADQLLHLATSPALQQRQIKQLDQEPSYLITTPPSNQHLPAAAGATYAYTPPIAHNHIHSHPQQPEAQQPVYEYQPDPAPYLVAGYPAPSDLPLGSNAASAPMRLAYLPASALQAPSPLSAMSGKALSAYASRLISMLRPSALLNSLGGQQQPHYPLHNQLTQGPYILLAPATTSLHPLPNERPRPAPKFQKPVLQELLLDQASFRSSASRLQHAWAHQHPSGLICVHSLATIPTNHQPQLVATDEQQHSSFDYVVGNELGGKGDDDDGFSAPTTTKPAPSKSSPARLSKASAKMAKVSAKDHPTGGGQLVGVQDKLKLNSSSLRDEQHGRRLGPSERQSIIPFTIKDKIEAPIQLLQLRNRQKQQQQGAYSPSSGVHFDEPAEEELGGRGPSKTSFSATTTSKPTIATHKSKKQTLSKMSGNREPVHNAIDYSRELGAQAGSLPLLIASSNRNRGGGGGGGAHNGPSAATTMSSSIATTAATAATNAEIATAAATAFGQISTRSSLGDSAPIAGNLSTNAVAAGSGLAEGGEIGAEEGGHSFSNNRLLSNMDNSMEEFARMSEQLQTNPMDLIDLQNARSNFELPAQLESLSMLYNSQQVATGSPSTSDSSEGDKQQRMQLGQLRWTTATTPASHLAMKQRQGRKKSRP